MWLQLTDPSTPHLIISDNHWLVSKACLIYDNPSYCGFKRMSSNFGSECSDNLYFYNKSHIIFTKCFRLPRFLSNSCDFDLPVRITSGAIYRTVRRLQRLNVHDSVLPSPQPEVYQCLGNLTPFVFRFAGCLCKCARGTFVRCISV